MYRKVILIFIGCFILLPSSNACGIVPALSDAVVEELIIEKVSIDGCPTIVVEERIVETAGEDGGPNVIVEEIVVSEVVEGPCGAVETVVAEEIIVAEVSPCGTPIIIEDIIVEEAIPVVVPPTRPPVKYPVGYKRLKTYCKRRPHSRRCSSLSIWQENCVESWHPLCGCGECRFW